MRLTNLILALAAIASTLQADTAPVFVTRGVVLVPGTFVQGQQPDGNSIVLRGASGVIVVDTGRHENHTRDVIAVARRLKIPVKAVINTHWHLDHIGGNALLRREYPGVRIYASNALEEARKGFLDNYGSQLKTMIGETADPAKKQTLTTELQLVEGSGKLGPDEIISESKRMDIDGRVIDVKLVRDAVTAGDVWMFDVLTRVVIAGDLVTLPVPLFDTACPIGWSMALADIAKYDFTTLIPGHGAPMTRAEFELYRESYANLLKCSQTDSETQVCIDGWMKEAAPLMKGEDTQLARSLLDYYVSSVLRGDRAKLRARCGDR